MIRKRVFSSHRQCKWSCQPFQRELSAWTALESKLAMVVASSCIKATCTINGCGQLCKTLCGYGLHTECMSAGGSADIDRRAAQMIQEWLCELGLAVVLIGSDTQCSTSSCESFKSFYNMQCHEHAPDPHAYQLIAVAAHYWSS